MKEKIIEILKYSTRIMENENHTDYLIDNIDEVADEIVKLCTIPHVSVAKRTVCDHNAVECKYHTPNTHVCYYPHDCKYQQTEH